MQPGWVDGWKVEKFTIWAACVVCQLHPCISTINGPSSVSSLLLLSGVVPC